MKKQVKVAVATLLTMASGIAFAGFSGTVAVTSDYDYRGITQTGGDPALQGSVLLDTETGFYASAWGSSLDWGKASDVAVEIDYFAGLSREFGSTGLKWDLGVLVYTYPGLSSANFVEYYGGLVYQGFNIKASYSDDFAGVGQSGWYINGGYTRKWKSGFSAFVHAGYSFGNAFEQHPHRGLALGFPDYVNYGVGVGYTMSHLYLEIKGAGTDLDGPYRVGNGLFANDYRTLLTAAVSFP